MVNTKRGSYGGPRGDIPSQHNDKSDDRVTEPKEDTHPSLNAVLLEKLRKLEDDLHQYREMMKHLEEVGKSTNKKGCTFKAFMSCKPPTYEGSDDPTIALRWLREMEQVFDLCDCDESWKVKFAVRMLQGRASDWWDMICAILDKEIIEQLSWARFVEEVKEEYCNHHVFKIERELSTMMKGNLTIEEHAKRFVEKLHLVCWLSDEASRVRWFGRTLPSCYFVAVTPAKTLYEAIRNAKLVEYDLERDKLERRFVNEKRKSEGSSGQSKKRVVKGTDEKKDPATESLGEARWCTSCRSCHSGECCENTMMCGRCGKFGHMVKDCIFKEPVCFTCQMPGHKSYECLHRKDAS